MTFTTSVSSSVYPTDFARFHRIASEIFVREASTSISTETRPTDLLIRQIALVRIRFLARELAKKNPGHVELPLVEKVISTLPKTSPIPDSIIPFIARAIHEGRPAVVIKPLAEECLAKLLLEFPSSFEFSGVRYPSGKHALLAQLFPCRQDYQREIASLEKERLAHFLITHFSDRRIDWETPNVKTVIMNNILFAKFTQNPECASALLATMDAYLVVKDDEFWGCGKEGTGRNELGLSLMLIREMLGGAGSVERPTLPFLVEDLFAAPASINKTSAGILEEIHTLNTEAEARDGDYIANTQIFRRTEYKHKSRCPEENYPFDSTLIHLKSGRPVNANLVLGRAYIGTQAPLRAAEEDFWRMALEQGSSAIVMLNEVSDYICYSYWPEKVGVVRVVGEASIRLLKDPEIITDLSWTQSPYSETPHGFVIRSLRISIAGEEKDVTHYQYLHWEDRKHGNVGCVLGLVSRLLSTPHLVDKPPIVHCAAGVGRTATFLTILDQVQALNEGREVDIHNCVARLRDPEDGRYYKAVQSDLQYAFCYETLRQEILNRARRA